jgi:RNA 2',3'-cyclic 3'-phosphodiesterase
MSETLRTFIAIDTPPEFKVRVEYIIKQLIYLNAPLRWEAAYKLHLTLKFLGDTNSETLDGLKEELGRIARIHKPFWMKYEGLGCFPDSKSPRIIWIGCLPLSSALDHLQQDIEIMSTGFGFDPEQRTFHPHITIGRVKTAAHAHHGKIKDLIKKLENLTFESLESEVHTIMLMKSELRPHGSVYSILEQFSFTQ